MEETGLGEVARRLGELAAVRVNDAVKLAFLDGERVEEIDGLDLTALTEFKRSGNGVVEVKLIDRMEALERIAGLLERGDRSKLQALLLAVREEKGAEE